MKLRNAYKKRNFQRVFLTIALFLSAAVLLWLSLISGSEGVRFADTPKLFEQGTRFALIVDAIRLPRALAALTVGMLLGLSGAVMQGVLRNPLASPFTLGISQASAFGASFAIIFIQTNLFGMPHWFPFFSVAFFAFIAGLLCSLLIIWFGSKASMSPTALILSGVGLGALFHSATMFLQYFTTDTNAAATLFWTFGDLSKATYPVLYILCFVLVVSLAFFWMYHWQFDALGFGDETAYNKGVNVKRFRIVMLLFASLCTAVAVAFFGIIGFIGLVAPHLVRLMLGSSHAALLPLSALCGGVLLLGADLAARMLLYPSVLPVGILTSFIGVPMLLYLLATKGKLR